MKDGLNLSISIEDINSILKKYLGSEQEIIVVKLNHQNKEKEIVPWDIEVVKNPDDGTYYAKWKCIKCGYIKRVNVFDVDIHDLNFCPRCGQQKKEYSEKGKCCCDE